MATKPVIKLAIAGSKAKASEYNDNFKAMVDYVEDSVVETNDYVASQVANMNNAVNNVRVIGQPIIRLNNALQSDEIRLEGAEVSRETYATLFSIYGTTYGAGDGSTTFKLPDFRNRAIWGSNGFGYLSAGLPNITGSFDGQNRESGSSGCFKSVSGAYQNAAEKHNDGNRVSFDASRSSSIYGGSSTVQPPAIKVRVVTRYK